MERGYADAWNNILQQARNKLDEQFAIDDYSEVVDLRGCRPSFDVQVLQRKTQSVNARALRTRPKKRKQNVTIKNNMCKQKQIPEQSKVLRVFKQWSGGKSVRSFAWVSNHLATDLNLSLETLVPTCSTGQVLFIAEGTLPILCVILKDTSSKEEIDEVEEYATKMAKRLKTFLANFCSVDFAILHFTVNVGELTVKNLNEKIFEEVTFTGSFFKGDMYLTAEACANITKAVDALVSGSFVPQAISQKQSQKRNLLLLDAEWTSVLSQMIEILEHACSSKPKEHLVVKGKDFKHFKIKVAILEALTRVSFSTEVVICVKDETTRNVVAKIRQQAKQDCNAIPKLRVTDDLKCSDCSHCILVKVEVEPGSSDMIASSSPQTSQNAAVPTTSKSCETADTIRSLPDEQGGTSSQSRSLGVMDIDELTASSPIDHKRAPMKSTQTQTARGLNRKLQKHPGDTGMQTESERAFMSKRRKVSHLACQSEESTNTSALTEGKIVMTLHEACRAGQAHKVYDMLSSHADEINEMDLTGQSPLHIAAARGDLNIVDMLMIKGGHVNMVNALNQTPLYVACKNNHIDVALCLCERGADVNACTSMKKTPLQEAVENKNAHLVDCLIEKGADVNNVDKKGMSPLSLACRTRSLSFVKLLKEHGANVNPPGVEGVEGKGGEGFVVAVAPLATASQFACKDIVEYLFQQDADVDGVDDIGATALHHAVQNGPLDFIEILLKNHANVDATDKDEKTPLHIATQRNNLSIVKLLLQNKAEVDVATNSGYTPLHIASQSAQRDIAQLILEYKADVDKADNQGHTALYLASFHGHMGIVKLLLQNNASVNKATNQGFTPLYAAAKWGCTDVVRLLLENGANVDKASQQGSTPLHAATDTGRTDLVRLLLENGADVDKAADNKTSTPLYWASLKGHFDIVELLIQNNADVNTDIGKGWTPLHAASDYGHTDIVRLLLKSGADVDKAADYGTTPLFIATLKGHFHIVQLLIQNSADVNKAAGGSTALTAASQNGHVDIVFLLLENGADVDTVHTDGSTPLFFASDSGNVDVVHLLLQFKADVKKTTTAGYTPLMVASQQGHHLIVGVLLKHGAAVDTANSNGLTPIKLAAKNGHNKCVELLLLNSADADGVGEKCPTSLQFACANGHELVVELLLQHKDDVDRDSGNWPTPLILSLQKGNTNIAKLLIQHRANVNKPDRNGNTPLLSAALTGCTDVVKLLLDQGCKVEVENAEGARPLLAASEKGHFDIVKLLLDHGANVSTENKHGQTAVSFAEENGHCEIFEYLLMKGGKRQKDIQETKEQAVFKTSRGLTGSQFFDWSKSRMYNSFFPLPSMPHMYEQYQSPGSRQQYQGGAPFGGVPAHVPNIIHFAPQTNLPSHSANYGYMW